MPLQITPQALRAIFPKAPKKIIDLAPQWQASFDKRGITDSQIRLGYCFANIEHECSGFTIPNLTEKTGYTHARMAVVWKNRFPGGAAQVRAKYGAANGWQLKALDDIYGNRMGNRPGTRDGSRYIGRGAPQITGRDGYRTIGKMTGLPLEENPELCSALEHQPEICAAFWEWKKLNGPADRKEFTTVVKLWNGGTNGMADRVQLMAGNKPIIARLSAVKAVHPVIEDLPRIPDPAPVTAAPVAPVAVKPTAEQDEPAVAAPEPVIDDPYNRDEPEPVKAVTAPPVPGDLPMMASTPTPFDPGLVRGDQDIWNKQRRLRARGYPPGDLDGLWGGKTKDAIRSFLLDRKSTIPPPEDVAQFRQILPALKDELSRAESENFTRPVSVARATATADELAPKVPQVAAAKTAERVGWWTWVCSIAGTILAGIVKYASDAFEWLGKIKTIVGDLPTEAWFGIVIFGIGLIYFITKKSGEAKNASTQSYNAGELA